MSQVRIRLPLPHKSQQTVIDSARRFNVLCCGRRWGKTELGIDRIIQVALPGFPCAWYAPSYKYSSPVFRELRLRLAPLIVESDKQEKFIRLRGGGIIDVWTLDSPDAGRGRKYKRVIVDEAAMVGSLEEAWEQSLRPQLTDLKGDAWFFSTPKGTAGYFHGLYQRGIGNVRPDWMCWQMPTAANPYIDPVEIESARADITDLAYAQEYLAQFVSWEGSVFRRIMEAVDEARKLSPAVVIGVDWGRTNDFTVFVALDEGGRVVEVDRFRGIEYQLQRARLAAFRQRTGPKSVIVAESNSMGGPVVEQLQNDGLPVYGFLTMGSTKSAIIDALALAFEREMIKIPNDAALIGELQAFEATRTATGLVRYGAPAGMHDDMVMALAIAWSGLCVRRETQNEITARQQRPSTRTAISPY